MPRRKDRRWPDMGDEKRPKSKAARFEELTPKGAPTIRFFIFLVEFLYRKTVYFFQSPQENGKDRKRSKWNSMVESQSSRLR
jgi:hypothetical protein